MKFEAGQWAKTYLFADGRAEVVVASSQDGFPAREKELNLSEGP